MKISATIFLCFMGLIGHSQQLDSLQKEELKERTLLSNEVKGWQNAMIAFQKSDRAFCALKEEQRLNNKLFDICGKPSMNIATEKYVLKLFRIRRITNELKEVASAKEIVMRKNHPEIATHFKGDEIFSGLYAPILKSRENQRF